MMPGAAQAGPKPQATIEKSIFIQSPREGQAFQGIEIIEGKIRGEGFQKGIIHFSYSNSSSQERTWFFIADIQGENQDSSQAPFRVEWDTSQITDGDYDLRVVAEYSGGAAIFELIPNLRIRNHTPVETPTPAPLADDGSDDLPSPSTPTAPMRSTPTSLPSNPAEVQSDDLQRVLVISGIVVAGSFFLGMIYWHIFNRAR